MKIQCVWGQRMRFSAKSESHEVLMDSRSPLGEDSALTPKQLLLASVCGCTGMDVVSLMRKYRQPVEAFEVVADAETTTGPHPWVFREIRLTFRFQGAIEPQKAIEAVRLSQTLYCGVSAMVSKAVPIRYTIECNGALIGNGEAAFP